MRVFDEDMESNGNEYAEGKKGEVQKGKKHRYGITMFHSLHCLGIMRGGVQELFREMEELKMEVEELKMEKMEDDEEAESKMRRGQQKKRAGGGHGHGHDFGHMEHGDPLHWLHCFDYLRQVCTVLTHILLDFLGDFGQIWSSVILISKQNTRVLTPEHSC